MISVQKTLGVTMKIRNIAVFVSILVLLFGCTSGENAKVKELEAKVAALESEKYNLSVELNAFQSRSYMTSKKNGVFECNNPYGGIQKVRFLAATVIYVTGVDEAKKPMFNNYYYYKYIDDFTLELVDDIDMPDSLEYYTFENIQKVPEILRTIKFVDDGNTITISPYSEASTCKFKKD
jgi:hypothetical protein